MQPSGVYKCPADKGQVVRVPCAYSFPPLKPSNFSTIGCSYQYNAGDVAFPEGGGFRQGIAGLMALQRESWVTDPVRFILLFEPPAQVYGCGAGYWCQWHYARGKSDILDPAYALQHFISPILFVDGHAAVHNFSKVLTEDPRYPYEPTKDWMWYKPATNSSG